MTEIVDFTTGFWTGWVVLITLLGLGFLLLLLYTVFSAGGRSIKSEPEVWDETLREGNSEPPKWWFFMFVGMIIFSCAYLVLYPGLGSYKGALKWTQFHQYEQARAHYDTQYAAIHQQWLDASPDALAADERAMATAARLYVDNCSGCHSRTGQGIAGLFPDLTDDEWIWGGDFEQIHTSVAQGRVALMTAQTAQLGGAGQVEAMARYVRARAGLEDRGADYAEQEQKFVAVCAACHNADGQGNPLLGAPSLVDDVWLYGSDLEMVIETIANGRNGVMPAQHERLGPARARLLAAWVASGAIRDLAAAQ